MKKFLIITLLLISSSAIAEDEVYLDLNLTDINRIDTGKLQYENTKTEHDDDMEYLKPSFSQIKQMFTEDFGKSENCKKL